MHKLSILIPVYNEAGNIPELCARLASVLQKFGHPYEIIAVNDGSKDASLEQLRVAAAKMPEIRVLDLRRNYGQTSALMAAIDHASGDILIPIDADLQNDPEDIPGLVLKLEEEGFDVVSGWRKERKDAPIRRNMISAVANWFISWISGVKLHDYGCTLKAYRRDVIKGVRLYGEMHRFIPIYATWLGAKVTEMPVQHHPRVRGKSNYGLERVMKVMLDIMVVKFLDRHFTKPIYVFGGFGLLSVIFSGIAGFYTLYLKYFEDVAFIKTPMPLLVVMAFITGVRSILRGLLAEMIVRTYFESQQLSVYLVREKINFEQAP